MISKVLKIYINKIKDLLIFINQLINQSNGSRIALVYNLTATSSLQITPPIKRRKQSGSSEFEPHADPRTVSKTLPPLPDVVLLNQIVKELTKGRLETDEDYSTDCLLVDGYDRDGLGTVPVKMVAVLSHFYTPSSLLGLDSLKGRDKIVCSLLHDALCCRHLTNNIPTLAQSSMNVVTNQKLPRQELDQASSASDLVSIASALIEEAAKPNTAGLHTEFDVYLTFVAIWDSGEMAPCEHLFTFGPKIPLFPDESQFEQKYILFSFIHEQSISRFISRGTRRRLG